MKTKSNVFTTKVGWYIFSVRLFNTLFIQTFISSDEFYQTQEIAHIAVFGYGVETFEWDPSFPIRNPFMSYLQAIPLLMLRLLRLDYPTLVFYSPKVVQAIITTTFDLLFLKWATRQSKVYSWFWPWCLVLYSTPFNISLMGRTFSNSLEATLFMAGLYFWQAEEQESHTEKNVPAQNQPKSDEKKRVIHPLLQEFIYPLNELYAWCMIGLNFCVRPTSLAIWPVFILQKLIKTPGVTNQIRYLIKAAIYMVVTILFSIVIESLYFGRLVSTGYNFFYFNFLTGQSASWGVSPFWWYFTEGIKQICWGWRYFLVIGVIMHLISCYRSKQFPIVLAAGTFEIFLLSTVGHKETRFLSKELPIFLYLIGLGVYSVWIMLKKLRHLRILVISVFIFINIARIYLDCRLDNPGPIQVMDYIRNHIDEVEGLGYATGGHWLPAYASFHKNIPTRNLFGDLDHQVRKLEDFIKDNPKFSHIIMYEGGLNDTTREIFSRHNFKEIPGTSFKGNVHVKLFENQQTLDYEPGYVIYKKQQEDAPMFRNAYEDAPVG